MTKPKPPQGQPYRVKRHRGTRLRAIQSFTLDERETRMLAELSALTGMSRSRIVGQLVRDEHQGYSPAAMADAADAVAHNEAMDIACPTCGALVGVRCFDPKDANRMPMKLHHAARRTSELPFAKGGR